jgi:hypothetical protein
MVMIIILESNNIPYSSISFPSQLIISVSDLGPLHFALGSQHS